MSCACPVWSGVASKSNINIASSTGCISQTFGNFRYFTPVFKMHDMLEIENVYDYIKKLSINYYNRIQNHENNLIRNIPYENVKYKHNRLMNIAM